jgi:hypothetical protein
MSYREMQNVVAKNKDRQIRRRQRHISSPDHSDSTPYRSDKISMHKKPIGSKWTVRGRRASLPSASCIFMWSLLATKSKMFQDKSLAGRGRNDLAEQTTARNSILSLPQEVKDGFYLPGLISLAL